MVGPVTGWLTTTAGKRDAPRVLRKLIIDSLGGFRTFLGSPEPKHHKY